MPSLAPAEQRVGKLVLLDPRSFASLPVSELADRAHVSKPTVVRFCRSMGYDGLSDFRHFHRYNYSMRRPVCQI